MASPTPVNPFLAARDQLVASLATPYPESYKKRVYAQWFLSALLFSLCVAHIIATLVHLRRRNKPLKLFRLQKLRGGNLIVLNTLFLYTILTAISAAVIALGRWKRYSMYFQNGSSKDSSILSTCTWSPAVISAVLYCHSNLNGSLAIAKAGRGIDAASTAWVWFSNATLVGLLTIYFAMTLPLACVSNHLQNVAGDKTKELLVLLTTAGQTLQSGGSPTPYLPQIAALKLDLADLAAKARTYSLAVVGVAIAYAFFYAFATVATLSFVWKLRKQAAWNRTRNTNAMPTSVMLTREQHTIVEGEGALGVSGLTYTAPASTLHSTPVAPFSSGIKTKTGKHIHQEQTEEQAALTRLSNDLAISTPLVMGLAFWFVFLGIFGATSKSTNIKILEMKSDGFAWPELVLNSIIICFFWVNLFLNTGKYGQVSELSASVTPSASASKKFHVQMQPFHSQPEPVSAPFEFSAVHFRSGQDEGATEKEKW